MPEFLTLLPPDEARKLLLDNLGENSNQFEMVETGQAVGRVTMENVYAPHPLPAFPRSTVDGYAVRARDTYGASDAIPGYLNLIGEIPMGSAPELKLERGQCALIHTGGMLPDGSDAVLMVEYTQVSRPGEIEVQRAVANGENLIRVGEDVSQNQLVISKGTRLRPAEVGGLMALGICDIRVVKKVRVGLISSGDEVIPPNQNPLPGQVRDINSFTLAALISQIGGEPVQYGIVPDNLELLKSKAAKALAETDFVVITAGSSASTRDMTADVIATLGSPGVLVHGINTRPGKPTILGVCDGKAVIGLPGNPVSALINGYLFAAPVIEKLLGLPADLPKPTIRARLSINLASQTGREDWQPVRLVSGEDGYRAEPVFGKSNLIFTLASANGLIKVHPDANGLAAGELVDVHLML